MPGKIALNGLKTYGPLAAVWVQPAGESPDVMAGFCRLLTGLRVNIAFLTTAYKAPARSLCCIDPGEQPEVAARIALDDDMQAFVRFGSGPVGLLSIYPHQASLKVLGVALHTLGEHGIRVHGLASSIAALTFVVDFDRLAEAAAVLSGPMALPPNAAPFQTGFKVRQERPAPRMPDQRPGQGL